MRFLNDDVRHDFFTLVPATQQLFIKDCSEDLTTTGYYLCIDKVTKVGDELEIIIRVHE